MEVNDGGGTYLRRHKNSRKEKEPNGGQPWDRKLWRPISTVACVCAREKERKEREELCFIFNV
jgi:hypothetical protein